MLNADTCPHINLIKMPSPVRFVDSIRMIDDDNAMWRYKRGDYLSTNTSYNMGCNILDSEQEMHDRWERVMSSSKGRNNITNDMYVMNKNVKEKRIKEQMMTDEPHEKEFKKNCRLIYNTCSRLKKIFD
tara:strand:- start:9608 stop:9994 length:387 start_codon:yes stop_codon:yes gene_type:complete